MPRLMWMMLAVGAHLIIGCASPEAGEAESAREVGDTRATGRSERTSDKEEPNLLEIQGIALTGGELKLDYIVRNAFPHDIWVCENVHGCWDYTGTRAETRILGETLRIRVRHGNLKATGTLGGGNVWARYRRLRPGELRVNTLPLAVPIANWSPVFLAEHPRARRQRVSVHHILLELGYFKGDFPGLLAQTAEKGWHFQNWDGFETFTYVLPQSEDPEVAFVPWPWKGTSLLEQAVECTVSDVDVPGELVTNPKNMSPVYREEWRDWVAAHQSR